VTLRDAVVNRAPEPLDVRHPVKSRSVVVARM
jgi:hypothetical protein